MKKVIENELVNKSLNHKVEELVDYLYVMVSFSPFVENIAILNDKYLTVNGVNYQFKKDNKNNKWIVKEF